MDDFLGAVIGAVFIGAVFGIIPAMCGIIKGKIGLAVGGFFSCIIGSLLLNIVWYDFINSLLSA